MQNRTDIRTVISTRDPLNREEPYKGLYVYFNSASRFWEIGHYELDLVVCSYLDTEKAANSVLRAIQKVEDETDTFWLMLLNSREYICNGWFEHSFGHLLR